MYFDGKETDFFFLNALSYYERVEINEKIYSFDNSLADFMVAWYMFVKLEGVPYYRENVCTPESK